MLFKVMAQSTGGQKMTRKGTNATTGKQASAQKMTRKTAKNK